VREQEGQIKQLTGQVEALKAKLVVLQQQAFGAKADHAAQTPDTPAPPGPEPSQGQAPEPAPATPKRKRGQQPGAPGHGRKRREELDTQETVYDVPEADKCCPKCGKPFRVFPGTEDSEEIDWQVRIVRRVHKRKRYVRDCNCTEAPGIVTAPVPAKLIPKGLFSTGFWTRVLLEKFLFHQPLHRICQALRLEGLAVSSGTLTGGLKHVGACLQPLYARLLEHIRGASHWLMDETRWMVFAQVEGKKGYRWWLWVAVTQDACVFVLDPFRSAQVPKRILGDEAQGILNVDRYSAYKALGEAIELAFCWIHVRRDFVRIRDGFKKLQAWATEWIDRINELFHINHQRVERQPGSAEFAAHDHTLRERLAAMAQVRDAELAQPDLHEAQAKALRSLRDHWQGLTVFVDQPHVPMGNNIPERAIKNPALGRKNFYGSGSVWSGMLAAMVYSILQTALLHEIDPHQFLLHYLQACAENGGQAPESIDAFLPWNLSPEQRAAWHYSTRAP